MITDRTSRVREMDNTYIQQREQELEMAARKRRGLLRRLSVMAIFVVALASIASVSIYTQASSLDEKRQEQVELEEQLKQLQAEEARLRQDIENYNDLDYIAEIARRDYYLTKPGETLFKLPGSSTN
ncbi:septum formation initiator family protein [Alkalihalobacillus sp. MEB130]|uniref:FtsB family cell division protein n=1 Tax=Alkalihalobacillus sp. MEB130 TaxID=2976704 RepID=UPI0028DFAA21|nr:septum formation initiator family protein [Alkalihalobacillus sp. MEB130]MDT8862656.1 septum formation initiator family protein [Alkalihalobacillus sp. MEB130]